MKITNEKLKLDVPRGKYLPAIQEEIRQNLTRMGVNGLTIDIRYDVASNVALIRFTFKGKNYEMKLSNQKDIRANMYGLNKRIEYKVRLHLLDIESFDVSVSPYLMIENGSGVTSNNFERPKASGKSYATLGVAEYASNDDIKKKYNELVRSYHPDNALSQLSKQEFGKRMAEINEAYTEIKNERGL